MNSPTSKKSRRCVWTSRLTWVPATCYQASSQDSQRNGHETCCAGIPISPYEWSADGLWVCVCVLLKIVFVDVLIVFVVLMMVAEPMVATC